MKNGLWVTGRYLESRSHVIGVKPRAVDEILSVQSECPQPVCCSSLLVLILMN